jgi:cytochrome P450
MSAAISLRELLSEEVRRDPYPCYARLHDLGEAVRLGERDKYAAAVHGYHAVDQVLRDPAFRVLEPEFADRSGTRWREHPVLRTLQASMFNAGGADLLRVRHLFGQVLGARRVTAMEPTIRRVAERALDRIAAAGAGGATVDFVTEFGIPVPADIIGEIVGVPPADRAGFPSKVRTFDAVLELGERSFRVLRAADAAADELNAYFADLVAARRADPRGDLISDLARAQAENPDLLTETELLANLVIFFNAGFRTTANLLGSSLTLLFDHPDARTALRADPSLCDAYVEEMLRYEPPVHFAVRYAAEDSEVGGVAVAKGQAVIVLIGAANRDPRQFPDPDTFDPTRTDNHHIAFSAGPHFCLGAALGRVEGRVIIPLILQRFPALALAGRPTGRRQYFMRGHEYLPVRPADGDVENP